MIARATDFPNIVLLLSLTWNCEDVFVCRKPCRSWAAKFYRSFSQRTAGSGTESGGLIGTAPCGTTLVRIRLRRSTAFHIGLTVRAFDSDLHLTGPEEEFKFPTAAGAQE